MHPLGSSTSLSTERRHLVWAPRRRIDRDRWFLHEATKVLSETVDFDHTLATVSRVALTDFADWNVVDLVEGQQVRVAVMHIDPVMAEWASRFEKRRQVHLQSLMPGSRTITRPEVFETVDEAALWTLVKGDPDQLRMVTQGGPRSLLMVPLISRTGALGAMTFARAEMERRYGAAELGVAEELALQCANALRNALDMQRLIGAGQDRDEGLALLRIEMSSMVAELGRKLRTLVEVCRSGPPDPAAGDKLAAEAASIEEQLQRVEHLAERIGAPEVRPPPPGRGL